MTGHTTNGDYKGVMPAATWMLGRLLEIDCAKLYKAIDKSRAPCLSRIKSMVKNLKDVRKFVDIEEIDVLDLPILLKAMFFLNLWEDLASNGEDDEIQDHCLRRYDAALKVLIKKYPVLY